MSRKTWTALSLALLAAAFAPGHVRATPVLGPEQTLDHGFRYPSVGATRTCAAATADSVVLLAFSPEGRIYGYRRGPGGREIDINPVALSPEGSWVGPFDISSFDGTGWKMAYLSREGYEPGWRYLSLRNIDPTTLQPTAPDVRLFTRPGLEYPVLAWTGTRHVLAWFEGSSRDRILRLVRVRPDMSVEEGVPVIASGIPAGPIALAADAAGGLLLWMDAEYALRALPLNDQGLPEGETVVIARPTPWSRQSFDVCRYRDGWLATWLESGKVAFARLDRRGLVLSPGSGQIVSDEWSTGATVGALDSTGVVLWRSGEWHSATVWSTSVVPGEAAWLQQTVSLATEAPYRTGRDFDLVRDLECVPSGRELIAVWGTWEDPSVGKSSVGKSSDVDLETVQLDTYNWPVYAQWLSQDALPRNPEPVLVTQSSHPRACGLHFGQGRFFSLIQDADTRFYLHRMELDADGRPDGEVARIHTRSTEHECNWQYCVSDRVGNIGVRSAGPALVCYGYHYNETGQLGTWIDQSHVTVDVVSPAGDLTRRLGILVDSGGEDGVARSPVECDGAVGAGTYLIAYSVPITGESRAPLRIRAELLNGEGRSIRRWVVQTDSACASPSVAALGSRYLLVWREGAGRPRLRGTVLDAAVPEGGILGDPLAPALTLHDAPYLIPGNGQILCAFPASRAPDGPHGDGGIAPLDSDIYTLRFGEDLAATQRPIPLCPAPGEQGYARGMWDGRQYVVTWSTLDAGSEALLGARVAAGGVLRDSIPFVIAPGVKDRAFLASDGDGTVLAGYGGSHVRAIHDSTPLLWDPADDPSGDPPPEDPPETPDDPPGGPPTALRIGGVRPNPSRGAVIWDLDLPVSTAAAIEIFDAAGRRVATERIEHGPLTGGWTWTGRQADGTAAPTGTYFLRITAGNQTAVRRATLIR